LQGADLKPVAVGWRAAPVVGQILALLVARTILVATFLQLKTGCLSLVLISVRRIGVR